MSIRSLASATIAWLCVVLVGCGTSGSPSPSPTPSPAPPPAVSSPPTATLSPGSANAFVGQPVVLTWSSTNATSCTASGGWNGALQASGNQGVTATAAGVQTYSIACTGAGGTANASATITATAPGLSLTNAFSPNAATISTSEGAPYGDADFWDPRGLNIQSRYGYGPTKVMRLYICLSGQVSIINACSQQPPVIGPLSAQMLAGIDAGIAAYARTGTRVLIRFIYNFGPIGAADAPIDLILTHLDQLAPILLKNRDLIFALEAGFIGAWGEWHSSTSGNTTIDAHKQLFDKELFYFKGVFPILLRAPASLIHYAGSSPQEGLGLHDDFYASDDAAWNPLPLIGEGTNYTRDQIRAYGQQVSRTGMLIGEFGAVYPPLQTCPALDAYSYEFHVQSISLNISPSTVGDLLQSNGCLTAFLNKLGTRIELQRATIIGNPTAGGSLFVALTMVNAGYGRVIRARPVTLVLISNGSVVGQVPISPQDLDLRQLASASPAAPMTFQFSVALPSNLPSSRPLSAALWIPDPAPSLNPQPAYALPLNSVDQNGTRVFDVSTGYNTIGAFTSGSANQTVAVPIRLSTQSSDLSGLTGSWAGDGPVGLPEGISMLTLADASRRWAVSSLRGLRGTPRIAWTLSQSGTNVNGTVSVTLQGSPLLTGTLVGTFVNGMLTYTVQVPAGAVPIAPACSGQLEGIINATSTTLVGSASPRGTACVSPLSVVNFVLTRQ